MKKYYVAPHVGAWIEIAVQRIRERTSARSLPMWERGLKYLHGFGNDALT